MPDTAQQTAKVPHDFGPHGAHYIAPDIHGQNFYALDRQFRDLMSLYMEPGLLARPAFEPSGRGGDGAATEVDARAQQTARRTAQPCRFDAGCRRVRASLLLSAALVQSLDPGRTATPQSSR